MSTKNARSETDREATSTTKNIWLDYSRKGSQSAFADALCALYYLPEQYKLAVTGAEGMHGMPEKYRDLISRVKILKKTGLSEMATPFAFICGDADHVLLHTNDKKAPTVVVTDKPQQIVKDYEWDGLTVPTEAPEALASAVLNIARNSVTKGFRLIRDSCVV